MEKYISRRGALKRLAGLMIISPILSLDALANEAYELSESKINELIHLGSTDSILQEQYSSGKIHKVSFNDNNTSNFRELVYQNNLDPSKRSPSFVYFFASKDRRIYNLLDTIVLKELSKKHFDQVKFVAYDLSKDEDFLRANRFILGDEAIGEGIEYPLLFAMYAKTNGKIKQLRIIKDGPRNRKAINDYVETFSNIIQNNLY